MYCNQRGVKHDCAYLLKKFEISKKEQQNKQNLHMDEIKVKEQQNFLTQFFLKNLKFDY